MKHNDDRLILSEQDRPELREGLPYQFILDRRDFLEVAGFVICLNATAFAAQVQNAAAEGKTPARLVVAPDGVVTVYSGKVEVGQGAATQLAMGVAEELRIPFHMVKVVLGDTDLCPNDGITAGSRTTPSTLPEVRRAAAERRGGPLTPPADWKVFGKSQTAIAAREIVTGQHKFPSDIQRPGMLYAAVLRAPRFNARLKSVNAKAVQGPGLQTIQDNNFFAIAAPNSYAARKAVAKAAATAEWEFSPHPSGKELFSHLKKTAAAPRENAKGNAADILNSSPRKLRATYQTAYIQHAPMEPRAAVAEWVDGKLTVWTGTQNPFGVRQQLMEAFRLTAAQVRVIEPGSGGGFGGKHTGEVAIEAARIAKETGKPVSLRWTRAEEFQWAYSRPAGLFEMEAALDEQGKIAAWDHYCYNAGGAGLESPYAVAHTRTRLANCDSPLRGGSYRGIAATTNNFARECFLDELAALAGQDPLDFRLAHIDNPRLRDVVLAAAKQFRWRERRSQAHPGTGYGLAAGFEKGSYVAACVAIEKASGQRDPFRITEFHMAYECGAILNPSNLRAQVEGSIIQGLGGALWEQMDFDSGQLRNGSFAQYRVPRFRDVPPLEIALLDRRDLPSVGAGETPLIAVAPALAGAIFDLTGERRRALPLL
jgi:isoquinoline 1-oxidoreductase